MNLDKKKPVWEDCQIFEEANFLNNIETLPIMISKDFCTKRSLACSPKDLDLTGQIGGLRLAEQSLGYQTNAYHQKRRSSVDSVTTFTTPNKPIPGVRADSAQLHASLVEHHGYSCKDKRVTLFKTEMCRTFEETGTCKYDTKCQFAHDRSELRSLPRHPRYKTEICKTFWEQGNCPYGKRCCFIHTENEVRKEIANTTEEMNAAGSKTVALSVTTSTPKEESRLLSLLQKHDDQEQLTRIKGNLFSSSFNAASWNRNSYKEESFLDSCMMGPIGSTSPFSNASCKPKLLHQDSIFENISVASEGSDGWDEESIGLLPSDLVS